MTDYKTTTRCGKTCAVQMSQADFSAVKCPTCGSDITEDIVHDGYRGSIHAHNGAGSRGLAPHHFYYLCSECAACECQVCAPTGETLIECWLRVDRTGLYVIVEGGNDSHRLSITDIIASASANDEVNDSLTVWDEMGACGKRAERGMLALMREWDMEPGKFYECFHALLPARLLPVEAKYTKEKK